MRPPNTWRFSAIGTEWSIDTDTVLDQMVRKDIVTIIESFDQVYSRFRSDSLVSRAAKQAGRYTFPDSAREIFGLYERLYGATGGRVTPLIGQLLSDLGYDADYSLHKKASLAAVPPLSILVWSDVTLTVHQPVLIDIGALGKGYLVDQVAAVLKRTFESFTVDAGGDIYTYGVDEKIGLEDPHNTGKVIGAVSIRNESLCGSATNRRRWGEGLHHIVDPDQGASTTGMAAVWVKAESAMLADALTTALFFVEPEQLQHIFNFEFICFYDNRHMRYSEGMGDIRV